MANPSGVHINGNTDNNGNSTGDAPGNTSGSAVPLAGPTMPALLHNSGISFDWTPEEQSKLEDLLIKYASDPPVLRYGKISQELNGKLVRDIALRCRWMNKKENGKRRKDDHNSRKSKDKKEKAIDSLPKSSHVANRSNGPPYVQPMMIESDDGISYKDIGGATGQLLEQSAKALDQISANFSAFKVLENVELFCQARTYILSILNDFSDLPDIMKQMPPLPVKLNEDLANSILPRTAMANNASCLLR